MLDLLDVDIALLTEAKVPPGRVGVWSRRGTLGRDGAKRPWTAAVVSRHGVDEIKEARAQWRGRSRGVKFQNSRPGSWVAALVHTEPRPISAVALYGVMDDMADASVHRALSEISPIVDDPRYNSSVLLGGDLNVGTQWIGRDKRFNARDNIVLKRIEAYGFVDCLRATRTPGRLSGCRCDDGEDCTHVQTRRDARFPNVPFQTDYLYASKLLAARLRECRVLATPEIFDISDHAPIVADFR